MTAALLFSQCAYAEDDNYPECAEVFGADLDFPKKPAAAVRYPFNCDATGALGLIPAGVNTVAMRITEECMCADSGAIRKGAARLSSGGGYMPLVGGRCEPCAADEFRNGDECVKTCPEGKVTLERACVTPGEKCTGRGWDIFLGDSCLIETALIDDGGSDAACLFVSSSGTSCYDRFGPNLEFPQKPEASRSIYPFNCDPDGTRGLIPATANTIYATNCTCANTDQIHQGATVVRGINTGGSCACPAGKIESADGLSCVCPADRVAEGNACVCPAGTTDLNGYCASPAEAAAGEKCEAAGWTFAAGACAVPVSRGGTISASCQIGGTGGTVGALCADVFGATLDFPQKPAAHFPVAAYVYGCADGAIPAGVNENGETTCACPGANMVYVEGECVEASVANKCRAKGWEVTVRFGTSRCQVAIANGIVVDNFPNDRFLDGCLVVENPRPGDESCHLEFGSEIVFPQRPADGSSPHYAFNCGTASGAVPANNGLLPASAANGATNCYCADADAKHLGATATDNGAGVTLRYGGVCLKGGAARAAAACEGAGWSLTSDARGWQCAIPVMRGTLSTGAAEGCYVSGAATLLQCSEVFGASYAFPAKPTGAGARYVFDCGAKMAPEGANVDGATMCECAATDGATGECVCGGGRVEMGGECVCGGGMADVGGLCVPETGVFGGVTVGVAAQAEICEGFGGRVLAEEGVLDPSTFTGRTKRIDDALSTISYTPSPGAPAALRTALHRWVGGDPDYFQNANLGQVNGLGTFAALLFTTNDLVSPVIFPEDNVFFCQRNATTNEAQIHCFFSEIPRMPVGGDPYACLGMDSVGTFCLLGSDEAFPCRGLFIRARDCNVKHERVLLNPFVCGPACPSGRPRGPSCE